MEPGLYIVATPIGNLEDISRRALRVLESVNSIVAEDTRITRGLLGKLGVKIPKLFTYTDFSNSNVVDKVLSGISNGLSIALVSDAGTPVISDPGYRLILAAQLAKYKVIPIPGPCAAIAALSISGLPTDKFLFEGFLPEKRPARLRRLSALCEERATIVLYEAPHRLKATIADCIEIFGGNRKSFLGRELTKLYETVFLSTLLDLQSLVDADSNQTRGELVLLIAGFRGKSSDLSPELSQLAKKLSENMSKKRVSVLLAEYSGLTRREIYDYLIETSAK